MDNRIIAAGVFGMFMLAAVFIGTGGLNNVNFQAAPTITPTTPQAQAGQECLGVGNALGKWTWIPTASGQALTCVVQTQPTIPFSGVTTTLPGGTMIAPQLVCEAGRQVSYNIQIENAGDDEAAPITRISNVTVYVDTSGNTITSSSTGAVKAYIGCVEKQISIFAIDDDNTGDDIYPTDEVILTDPTQGNVKYGRDKIPTYYTQSGVKYSHVNAPVTIKAMLQGNLSISTWDSTGSGMSDTNISLITYLGGTNSDTKIRIQETVDDRAALNLGIIIDIQDDMATQFRDVSLSADGLKIVEDSDVIPSYNNSFDYGFRLLNADNTPFGLDLTNKREDTSNLYDSLKEMIVTVEPRTTCTGSVNVTARVVDMTKVLDASGTKIQWKGDGKLYVEDDNNNNLGIRAGEAQATFYWHCS